LRSSAISVSSASEYNLPVFIDDSLEIGGVFVDYQRLAHRGFGLRRGPVPLGLHPYTKIGLAFRGIAQEERTALSLGINSDWVALPECGLRGRAVGLAAILILPLGTISVEGDYDVLINALAVCIVGGLGSTVGVIVASCSDRLRPDDHLHLPGTSLDHDRQPWWPSWHSGPETFGPLRPAEGTGRKNLTREEIWNGGIME